MKSGKLSLDNENLRLLLIVVGIACVFYLLHRYYNNDEDEGYINTDREAFEDYGEETSGPGHQDEAGQYNVATAPPQVNESANMNVANGNEAGNQAEESGDVNPAEAWGMNERPRGVDYLSQDGVAPGQIPNECYPKDTLKSADLLPGDANSVWAQVNPMGQGSLGDQNLLNSGYHVGINTVGQTLRNANMQLRSEPPNPQTPVSPWLQTTIEPDTNRRPMEIGSGE